MLTYTSCTLCPRRCGVDRTANQRGFCQMPGGLRVAKAMLHYGEEPPLCAGSGAGAVFFSGCTLRCAFCQKRSNRPGRPVAFAAAASGRF